MWYCLDVLIIVKLTAWWACNANEMERISQRWLLFRSMFRWTETWWIAWADQNLLALNNQVLVSTYSDSNKNCFFFTLSFLLRGFKNPAQRQSIASKCSSEFIYWLALVASLMQLAMLVNVFTNCVGVSNPDLLWRLLLCHRTVLFFKNC